MTQSRVVGEPLGHAPQPGDDLGELPDRPAAAELVGVVGDRFEAQHVFAVGGALQGHAPEVDLEPGQVPPRCLGHHCQPGRQVGGAAQARAPFGANERPQGWHVQPGAGPVDHRVDHAVHLRAGPNQQVAAVLDLVYDGWGRWTWAERMWVEVVAVERRHLVGTLRNQPIGIPRLDWGDQVKFKRDHIIDIHWEADAPSEPAEGDPELPRPRNRSIELDRGHGTASQ
ncbi:MAG TPA: DUF2314 domain-containing protein [Actinomycetes bacterium]|nr:DUF2314 domain-containing protein [Actinomycetes bacterium]